jgi:hypothetical protein
VGEKLMPVLGEVGTDAGQPEILADNVVSR